MMELLSPAGNYEAALAAFHGGADAIYLGGKSFSARMGADNFSGEELEKIIDFAHSIGKKVFVTLNTLVYQDEFPHVVAFAKAIDELSVDGVIVQDLGLASYLHQVVPSLPLHASTQLNCHNIEQAKALKKAGFVRVVLAREAPKEFISEVKALGLEVEVFIHGALCVCYSGNCLLSSFIGGRSGNRGRCAQPCRMGYRILENGKAVSDETFALSTKDLETIDAVKELAALGADSLKVEGRLKSKEYVYQTALAYRHAMDEGASEQDRKSLSSLFSRGFTPGFINGASSFDVLNQKTSSHQGERIGQCIGGKNRRIAIRLEKEVHRLDGIRFNGSEQIGCLIEKMFVRGEPREVAKPGEIIEIPGIDFFSRVIKQEVIRTTDHSLEQSIQDHLKEPIKVPVSGKLKIHPNEPLVLTVSAFEKTVTVAGKNALLPEKGGTPNERIASQLQKSGEYPYSVMDLVIEGEPAFVPISCLNELRNAAYESLRRALTERRVSVSGEYHGASLPKASEFRFEATADSWKAQTNPIRVFSSKSKGPVNQNRVVYGALHHASEELLHFPAIIEAGIDATASPYCNITNSYALDFYGSLGFSCCYLSLELDRESIAALLQDYSNRHGETPNVGIVVYGRPEMMILKSCPVGTHFKAKKLHCNRCHERKYELEDKFGERYPLLGDSICTTRLYASKPLFLLDQMEGIRELGVSRGLLLFTDEETTEIEDIFDGFGESSSFESERFTRGHYAKRSL